jgi:N-acetylglucosaminyldiphosphoundecaprenol N-acetyl-beta-D-mannosaminyltransferase
MTSAGSGHGVTWIGGCPLARVRMDELLELVERAVAERAHLRLALVDAAQLAWMRRSVEVALQVTSCELCCADGQTLLWLSRLLGRAVPERITGPDLVARLLPRAGESGWRLAVLVGRAERLEPTLAAIRRLAPGATAFGLVHPGERAGELPLVERILSFRPDLLLTGLPTPMEERFLFAHRATLARVPFVAGLGGSFDFLSGAARRAPVWMQRAGLEWLHRFLQEPRKKLRSEVVLPLSFYALLVRDRFVRRDPAVTRRVG